MWAVEHHFLEEYSHCSAPELFLTAVAMQTERIRVGHGAVVCVPQMNHPIRVAERAAVLDILSGGRLEFGTARASTWTELGGFGVDPDTTKISWDEYVHLLPRLWTEDRVAHRGASVAMPERPVLPKPVQDPHPPMWVTVTTPGTELDAADRGIGCLGVAAASFEEQERRTRDYRKRIALCDPVSSVVNDQVATMNFLYCHPDDGVATVVGGQMFNTFMLLNGHLLWTREVYPTAAYQSLANLAPTAARRESENPSERRPGPRRHRDRRPRSHRQGDQGLGGDRRGRRQLRAQHGGRDRAGGRAGVDAALRLRGDAVIRFGAGLMLQGTAAPEAVAATAPYVVTPSSEPLSVPKAELLQVAWEVDAAERDSMLPPALHPVNPPVVTFSFLRARECTHGPFTLAEIRVLCRSGIRTRGYHVGAFVDNPDVARALATGWGFRIEVADVTMSRRYDGANGAGRGRRRRCPGCRTHVAACALAVGSAVHVHDESCPARSWVAPAAGRARVPIRKRGTR